MKTRLYVFFLAVLAVPAAWAADQAVDYATQSITLALGEEPPDLNSMRSTDAVSFFVLGHVKEGLLRYDRRGRLAPGVAERWEVGLEGATFWLRADAKWSDGQPVTAADFVFAWRNAVDPQTASQYAYILYPIKHAEAVNRGEKPVEQLGVYAIDERTLKVEFEKSCQYFLSLTAFGTYYPVREDFFKSRGQRYAADAGDLLFNGPFKLTHWVHSASLRLEKNEHYWDRDKVQLNVIDVPYITDDPMARLNLFKDEKIAMTGLNSETLKDALRQKYKIRRHLDGAVFYLEFNHRQGRPMRNRNLRKAIQAIFDPNELVDKVIAVPGNAPGRSLIPSWIMGLDKPFREQYPAREIAVDLQQAQVYLQQAQQELGVDALPPLVYLTGDSPDASKQAEYMQNLFRTTLGIELKIDKQTFKQRLEKMTTGDFDLVAAGWGPDYDDPMTFADLFASWSENNRGRYASKAYDKWIRLAQSTEDPRERMDAMAKAQDLIIDDVVILPQYERSVNYVQHPKIKGIVRTRFGGDPNYVYARIVE